MLSKYNLSKLTNIASKITSHIAKSLDFILTWNIHSDAWAEDFLIVHNVTRKYKK